MTILLVRIPSAGVLPVVVVTDHGQTLQVRLATQGLVQPTEFDGGVAVDNIGDLELMVNQLIGYNYSWRPYGAPLTMHGFWYQAMVRFDGKAADAARATSRTGGEA